MTPVLHVILPKTFWGGGPPETCYRICSHWPAQGLPLRIFTSACLRGDPAGIMAPALPSVLPLRLQRRLASVQRVERVLRWRSERQAVAAVQPGDICYAWPGTSIETLAALRDRGGRIVLEFINTHVAYAKRLLDAEYDRIGAPRHANISNATLDEEEARLRLAEAAFAPGPFVETSIRQSTSHVPHILAASYGTYLPPDPPRRGPVRDRPLRFLFVGSIGLRKGAHVLMQAWRQARLPAELWFAGAVEPGLSLPDQRERFLGPVPETVRFLGHVRDIGQMYRDADVFVFPSFEEGGPQVTYEAAAYGLPLIVTPMGGGWIAREGETALVVPPADAAALTEALIRLHEDEDLRLSLGAGAAAAAPQFAWDRVADRRRQELLSFAGT